MASAAYPGRDAIAKYSDSPHVIALHIRDLQYWVESGDEIQHARNLIPGCRLSGHCKSGQLPIDAGFRSTTERGWKTKLTVRETARQCLQPLHNDVKTQHHPANGIEQSPVQSRSDELPVSVSSSHGQELKKAYWKCEGHDVEVDVVLRILSQCLNS
jgi:hypothetical protein